MKFLFKNIIIKISHFKHTYSKKVFLVGASFVSLLTCKFKVCFFFMSDEKPDLMTFLLSSLYNQSKSSNLTLRSRHREWWVWLPSHLHRAGGAPGAGLQGQYLQHPPGHGQPEDRKIIGQCGSNAAAACVSRTVVWFDTRVALSATPGTPLPA